MVYVPPPIHGLQCECCDKKFENYSAKTTSKWRTDAVFECPRCGVKLQYPPSCRLPGLFVRSALMILTFYLVHSFIEFWDNEVATWLGILVLLLAVFALPKSMGVKNRYIVMRRV